MNWLPTLAVLLVAVLTTTVLLHAIGLLLIEMRDLRKEISALHGMLDYRLGRHQEEVES
jgi:hypothetical protein